METSVWKVAALVSAAVLIVAGVALWLVFRTPPVPGWRGAASDAIASGDCGRAFVISTTALGSHVPGAAAFWMVAFGRPALEGEAFDCATVAAGKGAWTEEDDASFRAIVRPLAEAQTEDQRKSKPVGRWRKAWRALLGEDFAYTSDGEPLIFDSYAGVPFSDRLRFAWLTAKCHPVLDPTDQPHWRAVEQEVRQDMEGPWQAYYERCAGRAMAMARDLGIGQAGSQSPMIEDLLMRSLAVPEGRYLWARRILADGVYPTYALGDAERADAIEGLHKAAVEGAYGPALALYGHVILQGEAPVAVPRLESGGGALSSDQFAYGLLVAADAKGEDVGTDLEMAGQALTDADRAEAENWARALAGPAAPSP